MDAEVQGMMNVWEWGVVYFQYAAITAALVVACILIARFLPLVGTTGCRMPGTDELDWVSIAFLRGGSDAVLEIVDIKLAQKGLIILPSYTPVESANSPHASGSLEQLRWNYYQEAWKYCKKPGPKPTPELFKYYDLPDEMGNRFEDAFETQLEPIRQKLASLKLIPAKAYSNRERDIATMFWLVVLLGGTWFIGHVPWGGGLFDKAVTVFCTLLGLLSMSFLAFLVLFGGYGMPHGPSDTNALGKIHLAELKKHYNRLYKNLREKNTLEENEFATAIAVYGLKALRLAPFFMHPKEKGTTTPTAKRDRIKDSAAEADTPVATEALKTEKRQSALSSDLSSEINSLKQRLERSGWKHVQAGNFQGIEFDLVGSFGGIIRKPKWYILVKMIAVLDQHALAKLKKEINAAASGSAKETVLFRDELIFCIVCETIDAEVARSIESDSYLYGAYVLIVNKNTRRVHGEVPSHPAYDHMMVRKAWNALIDGFGLTDKPSREIDWLKWAVAALGVALLIYVPFKGDIERLLSPETSPKQSPASSPADDKKAVSSSDGGSAKTGSSPDERFSQKSDSPASKESSVPASSLKITAAKLQRAARNFEKQYPKRFTNIALGEWLRKQTAGFTPDAVEWLQKRYGRMNGNLDRYQQVLDTHIPGARLVDSNSDGIPDANDLMFERDGFGRMTAQLLGTELRDRIRIESAIIEACREIAAAKLGYAQIGTQKVPARCWQPSGKVSFFEVRAGVRPSEAVRDVLAHPGDYQLHSGTAGLLAYYVAVLKLIGPEDFDQTFRWMQLGPQFGRADAMHDHVEFNREDPRVKDPGPPKAGDIAYFAGGPGANVIFLGGGKLFCHPLGITTEKAVVAWLTQHRGPGQAGDPYLEPGHASLMSDVLAHDKILDR